MALSWIVLKVSLLALCVAMVAGLMLPELFLLLPNGFVLWAISGNQLPPYFDLSTFNKAD